jgi:hypothetical protein
MLLMRIKGRYEHEPSSVAYRRIQMAELLLNSVSRCAEDAVPWQARGKDCPSRASPLISIDECEASYIRLYAFILPPHQPSHSPSQRPGQVPTLALHSHSPFIFSFLYFLHAFRYLLPPLTCRCYPGAHCAHLRVSASAARCQAPR